MSEVADGTEMTGSTASGVANEEKVQGLFFLWSAFGLLV
jgi:hypothetical protein